MTYTQLVVYTSDCSIRVYANFSVSCLVTVLLECIYRYANFISDLYAFSCFILVTVLLEYI